MNWQLAADAAVAKPKPSRRSRFSVFGGGNASKGEHMHVVQSFEDGSTTEYFTVKGSSIFSQPVMLRSMTCAFLGQMYYIANMMRPDKGIDTLNNFYFEVLGNCLSLLLVFKSNVSYIRFWEARTHVGSLLNHLRSFTRRLLFSSDLRAGDAQVEAAIENMFRWQRAFFILLMQDVRLTQDLGRISDDVITNDEKEFLLSARRRPLTVLGGSRQASPTSTIRDTSPSDCRWL